MAREYTNKLYEMIDYGYVSKDQVIDMALSWLSEHDVKEMMERNELLEDEEEEEGEY